MKARHSVLLAAVLVPVPVAAGCGSSSAAAGTSLDVVEVTIDKPANPQQGAIRLVIRNATDTDDALTGASSPKAKRATIHRTTEDAEGRSSMEMLQRLDIPADGAVTFDPSTYHVMLEGFAKPLQVGDEVAVTFTFEQAGKKQVTAEVIEPGTANEHDRNHDEENEHG